MKTLLFTLVLIMAATMNAPAQVPTPMDTATTYKYYTGSLGAGSMPCQAYACGTTGGDVILSTTVRGQHRIKIQALSCPVSVSITDGAGWMYHSLCYFPGPDGVVVVDFDYTFDAVVLIAPMNPDDIQVEIGRYELAQATPPPVFIGSSPCRHLLNVRRVTIPTPQQLERRRARPSRWPSKIFDGL